jgi:phage baseplate assembly protein W
MARILSYPFRLGAGGTVAVVDQDSDAAQVEQLAVLVLTRTGERGAVPDFGLRDPAFRGVDVSELVGAVARWGPPVRLVDVTAEPVAARPDVTAVRVTFT